MSKRITQLAEYNMNNYQLCYEAWMSEGTLERATIKLEKDGVLNSYGRPYSAPAVRVSAVKYMTAHYEETKQRLKEEYAKQGYNIEDENLERYLIKLAISALRTEENVIAWLKKNGLYGKHVEYIESLIYISYDD